MSRDKYETGSLEIPGNLGRSVKNKYYQQTGASDNLALIYPGLRYSCDKPLLYYTTKLLLERGYDVLQLRANYRTPQFQDLSQADRTIQLIEDGKALLNAGRQAKSYSNLLLTGKSLGTLTMAFIFNEDRSLLNAKTIWLTPLMHLPPVSQISLELTGPAFVVGSDADPTFESEPVTKIQSMSNTTMQIIKHANHSLEIPGEPLRSLQILIQVMENMNSFLS
ncbi:MAG: hypothetical protein V3U36_00700 [Anaerolineales bacterium]|jgi:hypothetical protein